MRQAQPPESIFTELMGTFHLSMKPSTAVPARPGDTDAGLQSETFEVLFAEHWPRVYRVLLRLVGDPAEAEDLALESFFRLYNHRAAGAADFNPGGWLHRVAVNLGLHSIRSFKRRERYELAAGKGALAEAPEDRPPELVDSAQDQQMVRIVLADLPSRQSELLILRHSGASYKETAAALGLAPSSIGPSLLRAEREFEKRYRALVREEP